MSAPPSRNTRDASGKNCSRSAKFNDPAAVMMSMLAVRTGSASARAAAKRTPTVRAGLPCTIASTGSMPRQNPAMPRSGLVDRPVPQPTSNARARAAW